MMVVVLVGLRPAAAAYPGKAVPRHDYLQRSADAGALRGNKVVFSGTHITIAVVAVAPGAPDATFEIHGRVNPTLVVPAGAKIRFELANADRGMPHGLDVTRKGPPYAVNLRLSSQRTRTPRKKREQTTAAVTRHATISLGVVPKAGRGPLLVKHSVWFTLSAGVYHYVCPVPGHARNGMHGRIIVKEHSL